MDSDHPRESPDDFDFSIEDFHFTEPPGFRLVQNDIWRLFRGFFRAFQGKLLTGDAIFPEINKKSSGIETGGNFRR